MNSNCVASIPPTTPKHGYAIGGPLHIFRHSVRNAASFALQSKTLPDWLVLRCWKLPRAARPTTKEISNTRSQSQRSSAEGLLEIGLRDCKVIRIGLAPSTSLFPRTTAQSQEKGGEHLGKNDGQADFLAATVKRGQHAGLYAVGLGTSKLKRKQEANQVAVRCWCCCWWWWWAGQV